MVGLAGDDMRPHDGRRKVHHIVANNKTRAQPISCSDGRPPDMVILPVSQFWPWSRSGPLHPQGDEFHDVYKVVEHPIGLGLELAVRKAFSERFPGQDSPCLGDDAFGPDGTEEAPGGKPG